MNIIDNNLSTEKDIMACLRGRAPSDLQVNGKCASCEADIFWQATAPKAPIRWCLECVIQEAASEKWKDVEFVATKAAIKEVSTILGEAPETIVDVVGAELIRRVEEEKG